MMIHAPNVTDTGIVVEGMTEFVDLFPTLVDLAGFAQLNTCPEKSAHIPLCTEGESLTPLITNNTNMPWKQRVFSQFPRKGPFDILAGNNNYMGYTMRTERYRYTEWVHFSGPPKYEINWNKNVGVELYDHRNDAEENVNLAHVSKYQSVIKELRKLLHGGWRNGRPSVNL